MNLKFYKTGTKPTTIGSLWFNPTTKRIELITGTSTSDVYGSDIQDATYSNDILTIEKIDGSAITINLSNYATSSELENSLANKLNKIKVNNSTVNSADLNIVGSGGTTVSNNSGTITISSETAPTSFDASAITSGTISLERLPKGALERLFIVSSENDAMNADCQEGDTVQVTGNNNKMYFCVNGSATTFANKFREYTAGAATSVPWSGVTGKPTIPSKVSQLENDSNFLTSHQELKTINNESIIGSGNITIEGGGEDIVLFDCSNAKYASYIKDYVPIADFETALSQNKTIKIKWENTFYTYVFKLDFSSSNYFYFTATIGSSLYEISLSKINNTWSSSDSHNYTIPDTDNFITTGDLTDYLKTSDANTTYLKITDAESTYAKTTDIPVKSVNGLTGEVVIPVATSESLGTVKVGSGLSIDSSGVLSTTVVVPTKVSDLTNDSGFITETSLSDYAKTTDIPTESTIKSMFSTETWTFTMENGTEITKTIYIA